MVSYRMGLSPQNCSSVDDLTVETKSATTNQICEDESWNGVMDAATSAGADENHQLQSWRAALQSLQ